MCIWLKFGCGRRDIIVEHRKNMFCYVDFCFGCVELHTYIEKIIVYFVDNRNVYDWNDVWCYMLIEITYAVIPLENRYYIFLLVLPIIRWIIVQKPRPISHLDGVLINFSDHWRMIHTISCKPQICSRCCSIKKQQFKFQVSSLHT